MVSMHEIPSGSGPVRKQAVLSRPVTWNAERHPKGSVSGVGINFTVVPALLYFPGVSLSEFHTDGWAIWALTLSGKIRVLLCAGIAQSAPGPEDISARTKPGPGKWFLMVLRWGPGEGLGVRPQVLQTNCGVRANPACARDRSLTILFVY